MDSLKQHSDEFYRELLDQYVSGDISDKDLHLLQKKALDDPFLADALEGFHYSELKESSQALKDIKPARGITKTRTIPMRIWMSLAASVLLLITIGFLLQSDGVQNQDLAMESAVSDTTTEEKFADNLEGGISEEALEEEDSKLTMDSERQNESNVEILAKAEPKEKERNELKIISAEKPKSEISRKKQVEVLNQDNESEALTEEEIPELPRTPTAETYGSSKPELSVDRMENNQITGKVFDSDSLPLIGAQVTLKQDNKEVARALTDIDGNYTIQQIDTGEAELEVVYTGYDDYRVGNAYIAEGLNNYDVELSEGALLDEVVVASYKSKELKDVQIFEPIEGYEAFAEYVRESTGRMQADFGTAAYVVLEFDILADGGLDKIKVLESSNESLEDEAIRILKEGGPWKVIKPANPPLRATYRMEF